MIHAELVAGLQPSARYTVRAAVDDWLERGLSAGRSERCSCTGTDTQQTGTTELVYRRELRPVITAGAEIMDRIFSS